MMGQGGLGRGTPDQVSLVPVYFGRGPCAKLAVNKYICQPLVPGPLASSFEGLNEPKPENSNARGAKKKGFRRFGGSEG